MASAEDPGIEREKVELVYRLAPSALITALVVGAITWTIIRAAGGMPWLNHWLIALIGLTGVRLLLVNVYLRKEPRPQATALWSTLFLIGAGVGGALWGFASYALLPVEHSGYLLGMVFVIAGLSAGAMTALSPLRGAFPAFIIPFLLPFAIKLFGLGGEAYPYIAFAALLFMVALIVISVQQHRHFAEALAKRFEAIELSDRLDHAARQAAATQKELKTQIAQRMKAEVTAKDQRLRLDLLLQETPLASIEWSRELTIKEWNPAAERIFGYSREEVLGKDGIDLIVPVELRDWTRRFMTNVLNAAGSPHGTFKNCNKRGDALTCEWYNTPMRNGGGEIVEIVSLALDVTERFEAERMKDRFITTVSHELRTPLTAVSGALSLLASGVAGNANEEAKRLINLAERNSKELLRAVDDVIALAKIDQGKTAQHSEPVSLLLVLRQALLQARSFIERFNATLKLVNPVVDARVKVDIDLMIRTFVFLAYNAASHSPPGSVIEVSVERSSNEAIRVSVKDRGPGMSQQARERAFSDFSVLDPLAGRGLGTGPTGLAAVKALVERQGGTVALTSEPGAGTTVIVILPVER
jgi:PAS domain S-box-containing protein